jgi:Ca2+-binding EF-hand superfamily protein
MKLVSYLLAVSVACLLSVTTLGAQDDAAAKRKAAQKGQAEMAEKNFKNLDKDGDRLLTFDEYKKNRKNPKAVEKAEQIFKLIDADNDLKVTLEEFKSRPTEARFKQMDRDNDGNVTFDEFKGKREKPEEIELAERAFKRIDTNGDKKLSLEEFAEARKRIEARQADKKPAKKKFQPELLKAQ